ncbi:MAG: hypothetical protein KDC38_15800 [Planctomycetes bacterium]|nr:hypothetical protein [Planctomycetota bacterium]
MGETWAHLRRPISPYPWVTLRHLGPVTTFSDAWEMYVATGDAEGGLGVALLDLFAGFLGPYEIDPLLDTFTEHLDY